MTPMKYALLFSFVVMLCLQVTINAQTSNLRRLSDNHPHQYTPTESPTIELVSTFPIPSLDLDKLYGQYYVVGFGVFQNAEVSPKGIPHCAITEYRVDHEMPVVINMDHVLSPNGSMTSTYGAIEFAADGSGLFYVHYAGFLDPVVYSITAADDNYGWILVYDAFGRVLYGLVRDTTDQDALDRLEIEALVRGYKIIDTDYGSVCDYPSNDDNGSTMSLNAKKAK